MNFIGLISGGKDSIYNIICCIRKGHKLIALGHLSPPQSSSSSQAGEMDSYMYQTVGSEICDAIAQCLNVPLIKREIGGVAINKEMTYSKTDNDEVEELYHLLSSAKEQFPTLEAVSSGAILSSYQKNRVENVCERLQLTSLALLWERDQKELLDEMIACGMEGVLIKTCAIGLDKCDVMKSIKDLYGKFMGLEKKYKMNVCGEGGEYETITLDCDLYCKRIIVDKYDIVPHSLDPFSPVYYAVVKKYHLEDKSV